MLRLTPALIVLAALATAAPAHAQVPDSGVPDGSALIFDGIEKLRRGFERLIEDLPRYEAPRITEDGDIILRRIPPGEEGRDRAAPPEPAEDGTIRI